MTGELVLVTGGTGFIGFRSIRTALEAGYRVRAAVRREAAIPSIKDAASIQKYLSQLEFVLVEDITKEGAFREALKGVVYVLHIASPLARPSDDYETEIIQPAVQGTTSILRSASEVPSVKRVVITSSVAAVVPGAVLAGMTESDQVYTADNVVPSPSGPYPSYMAAYAASKTLALHAAKEFQASHRPSFTIVYIMPSFVMGPNELANDPQTVVSGTNRMILGVVLGNKSTAPIFGLTVHVDDVAYMHVKALDPSIKGDQNFAANGDGINGMVWEDALEIVKRRFPDQVQAGILALGGTQPTLAVKYDASRAEEVLGFKFKGYEDQVVDLVQYYVEATERAKAGSRKKESSI